MYSVVLTLATMTAQEVPQGLFFARGNCSGNANVSVRTRVHTDAAPRVPRHPIRTLLGHFVTHQPVRTSIRTVLGGPGTCNTGAAANSANVQTSTSINVTTDSSALSNSESAFLRAGITHAAVHRQLRVALRSQMLNPEQAVIAKKALANPDVYETAVSRVHLDLVKKAAAEGITVQKFGDGTILKMLLDNLPQIIAALTEILKLFHIG